MQKDFLKKSLEIFIFFFFFSSLCTSQGLGKDKDTFSISLVRKATVKETKDRRIVYERYRVKKGDYIWKLLRRRGLLDKGDSGELISLIKGMNPKLRNLDIIHPGQNIMIPIDIVPLKGHPEGEVKAKGSIDKILSGDEIDLENYRIRPGDSLTMVVQDKYEVPTDYLYDEYLSLIRALNPSLKDLNRIYPGQVIKLPIYSPQVVKKPIERKKKAPPKEERVERVVSPTPEEEVDKQETVSLKKGLKDIFTRMGEEWLDTGKQFIPLKSGGQIHLEASSFPVLNLANGIRLIVDLKGDLPGDVRSLIETDWEDYRIVTLDPEDKLREAVDKILGAGGFYKIIESGENLKTQGDIDISIGGDWVVMPVKSREEKAKGVVVITLLETGREKTPGPVKDYLGKMGIRIVDYPDFSDSLEKKDKLLAEHCLDIDQERDFPLASLLLDLAGQPFSKQVEIPVYQGEKAGFKLTINADIFFNRNGRDCIIDLSGLSPRIVSLLQKHQFMVLSLSENNNPMKITESILQFLGVSLYSEDHEILAAQREVKRNIKFKIPGITFFDKQERNIFVTGKRMPEEMKRFLSYKGFYILDLSQLKG